MAPRKATKRPNASTESQSNSIKSAPKKLKRVTSVSSIQHPTTPGIVLTLGTGSFGQLGLGETKVERKRPARVTALDDAEIVQVVAGGMHTLCLGKSGKVHSFGCNDEGALGRDTSEDGSDYVPGIVELPEEVVVKQVCCGDSHSAALTNTGKVYIWGIFRNGNGQLGMLKHQKTEPVPVELQGVEGVIKICSGDDHIVCLTDKGDIYTMGNPGQGRLGRLAAQFCNPDGRSRTLSKILSPGQVRFRHKATRFDNIWAGSFCTFMQQRKTGRVFAFGLNNYGQLGDSSGFTSPNTELYTPVLIPSLTNIKEISGGQHHTVALTKDGEVLSFGRHDDGRLGLPESDLQEVTPPTRIPSLDPTAVSVDAGNCVSYSVDRQGAIYSCGFGENLQLANDTEEPEDDVHIPGRMVGQQLEDKRCLSISGGGQHTVILAKVRE